MVKQKQHEPGPPMNYGELLDLARNHFAEGRRIVVRQSAVVHALKAQGRNTRDADGTLRLFEDSLLILEEHLSAIEAARGTTDGR
jgi:hypothetical protein